MMILLHTFSSYFFVGVIGQPLATMVNKLLVLLARLDEYQMVRWMSINVAIALGCNNCKKSFFFAQIFWGVTAMDAAKYAQLAVSVQLPPRMDSPMLG